MKIPAFPETEITVAEDVMTISQMVGYSISRISLPLDLLAYFISVLVEVAVDADKAPVVTPPEEA